MLRNRIYYGLKPFVPQSLRTAVRRRVAVRVRRRIGHVWPIVPGSERPPQNWQGWPQGKKFAFVLTHDVENSAGLANCRLLAQLESEFGFRSSFNFVPEGEYQVPADLRNELTAAGFEVGIHDLKHDGHLFDSHRGFKQCAAQINRYAREWKAAGFRSGFMMSNLDWLHELDVEYDASTFDTDPFEPQPDGSHTIFPFWVPRLTSHEINGKEQPRSRGYVELPYTLPQDSTLFLLLRETTPELWMRKLDWIAQHGGMVLLDSHPDYMSFGDRPQTSTQYPVSLYREFLTYVKTRYAGQYWHVLPRQIAHHVRTTSDRVENAKAPPLFGKRAAVLLFSHYPADPRPRRAAEAIAAEGVSVHVICLRDGDNDQPQQCYGRINVTRVGLKRKRGGKLGYVAQYAAFIVISFLHLTARSMRRRYDFVHVHNMPDALVFSAIVPKLLGAKLILDLHDPMPELMQTIFKLPEHSFSVGVLKRLEKWSSRFADLVITVNLACKRIYSSRSCEASKIQVVINSPDDEVFRMRDGASSGGNGANGNGSKPFVILYHGSLVQRNGFDLAVDSLEQVLSSIPSVRLSVCGRRTQFFDRVMESAARRGLEQRIDYLGICDQHEVVDAIKHCDLGIIPNHRNIFTEINTPTRIFEYLALGKPVIAPKTRGIQDYFADNELIFFEVGSTDDLARQIEFAYSHPTEVAETLKRGQAIYVSQNWQRQRTAFLNAVGQLLQTGTG